ncbi:MAG TPA: hypothetical protein VMQ65_06985 [Candidatus Limnocylindria bacterium]|nr:hypothetical protein [Candidatus Limnocylindria bacterium]
MGDFVRAIGEGVSGLVGGSIDALGIAFSTIVGALQTALPGPLLPIAIVGAIVVLALLYKRLF